MGQRRHRSRLIIVHGPMPSAHSQLDLARLLAQLLEFFHHPELHPVRDPDA